MGRDTVAYTDPIAIGGKEPNLIIVDEVVEELTEAELVELDAKLSKLSPSVMITYAGESNAPEDTDAEDTPKEASDEVSNPTPQAPERKAKRRNSKKR